MLLNIGRPTPALCQSPRRDVIWSTPNVLGDDLSPALRPLSVLGGLDEGRKRELAAAVIAENFFNLLSTQVFYEARWRPKFQL